MRPIVGITCCYQDLDGVAADCVLRKYTDAVVSAGGCLPLLIPTLGGTLDAGALFSAVDGLLFTGSPTNIEPAHYGEAGAPQVGPADPRRDATTIGLIRAAVSEGVPVLALCRGFQELNVAYGGTLHRAVHDLPDTLDHREDETRPEAERYEPAHEVRFAVGGLLAGLFGEDRLMVNSLHGQAIARLAPRLSAEARAPDGIIEAASVTGARRFALGVQWHPEWRAAERPASRRLFEAFAGACAERRAERLGV